MVQVDLITGFLGAGKTTFLRRYAAWWAGQGVKVCVLENDFGAVNVDAMLLQDLEARGVELGTVHLLSSYAADADKAHLHGHAGL